jgi:replication factor C large subunit
VLKRISENAGLAIEDSALIRLAKSAQGDLRSAINDLQALSMAESNLERIGEQDIVTGDRDREEDIFDVLKLLFGAEGYDLQTALSTLYSLDKTPEESILWVYKNFSYEYDDESFSHGLQYLSRADLFLGRVRQREDYRFWRYASGLMAGSVLSAKELQEERSGGWERRKPRYFQSPWFRAKLPEGEARKSGPLQDELAKKIAHYSKVPRSYALFFALPFLPIFFVDDRKAAEITASLRLEVTEIAFLLGETEEEVKERAQKIYEEALAIAARKRKERGTEETTGVVTTPDRRETIRAQKAETTEEESAIEEEDHELKNQRTLTDFF